MKQARDKGGRLGTAAQRRPAQVVDIAAYRAATSVSETQVVSRFRAGVGIQAISRQTKWPHDRIQRAIRAQLVVMPRAA